MSTMAKVRMRAVTFLILAALLAFPGARADDMQPPPAGSAAPAPKAAPRVGHLYVFNDSGRTLIPSNQVITDNGRKLVSLPRQTYAAIELQPGPHLLKPDPPLWKQQVLLDVVAGSSFYVVVAYKPERSWAAPLAGAPLLLFQITEEQATPLLREMQQR